MKHHWRKNGRKLTKNEVFNLGNDAAYQSWRVAKLGNFPIRWNESIVTVEDLAVPRQDEISKIVRFCEKFGLALYETGKPILDQTLADFCRKLGLFTPEGHRSAAKNGVVHIEQTATDSRGGYIPYTNKPLSWHTDGYYNPSADQINAMVLHCVRDASKGGVNELLDSEIAYIRLRDENPAFINALMDQEAMLIPENTDPRSKYRPDSIGPVFSVAAQGDLHMRYTARKRNIVWKNDKITDDARSFLTHILENDPLIVRHKLKSGQGIISNNVLHNRTGFVDEDGPGQARLLYRIRYKERVTLIDNPIK